MIWRAFELRPDPVPSLPPAGDYLQRAWKNSVLPLAERLGVTMRLPPVQPRSRRAHQAAQWARTQGRFDDYHHALFRAFFERGEDIGQDAVLLSLAPALGLDEGLLAVALSASTFEASVLADEDLAQSLGLRGVPAFVANRTVAASGVQTLDGLQQLMAQARE